MRPIINRLACLLILAIMAGCADGSRNNVTGPDTNPPPATPSFNASIVNPTSDTPLSGVISLKVSARGGNPSYRYTFLSDASSLASGLADSVYALDTRQMKDGQHMLEVVVTDALGKQTSASVTVTVQNATAHSFKVTLAWSKTFAQQLVYGNAGWTYKSGVKGGGLVLANGVVVATPDSLQSWSFSDGGMSGVTFLVDSSHKATADGEVSITVSGTFTGTAWNNSNVIVLNQTGPNGGMSGSTMDLQHISILGGTYNTHMTASAGSLIYPTFELPIPKNCVPGEVSTATLHIQVHVPGPGAKDFEITTWPVTGTCS